MINPDTRMCVWPIFPNRVWLIDCFWQGQQPHVEVLLMPMICDEGVIPNQKRLPFDQRWLSPKWLACHDHVWHADKICSKSISLWLVPVIMNPILFKKVMVFILITQVVSRPINSPYGLMVVNEDVFLIKDTCFHNVEIIEYFVKLMCQYESQNGFIYQFRSRRCCEVMDMSHVDWLYQSTL